MTVLATVRNTGSHTIHNIFRSMEMHYLTEDPRREPRFWFGHTEPANMPLIKQKASLEPPLVLAMRNPVDVAKSWIRRAKLLDHTFKTMWQALFSLKDEITDSYWLPIDVPDRDGYLDAIENRIGVKLNRDWTPKGVFTAQNYGWQGGMTMDEAVEWLRALPFDQFGYELNGDNG